MLCFTPASSKPSAMDERPNSGMDDHPGRHPWPGAWPQARVERAVFGAAWVLVWLSVVAIASLEISPLAAVRLITPAFALIAGVTALAFAVANRLPSLPLRGAAIAGLIAVAAVVLSSGLFADLQTSLAQNVLNLAVVVAVAFAIRAALRSALAHRRVRLAERRQTLAEQRAMNARLAPHTLFNMLNAIYAASLRSPERASALVLAMAGMMRHLTSAADRDFVPAQDELDFIRNHTEMLRARSDDHDIIELDFPEGVDLMIPGLLCVSLFENAVSHGRDAAGTVDIAASFAVAEDGFTFTVSNRIGQPTREERPPVGVAGMGSGLASVRARLDHLYPGRNDFTYGENAGRYIAKIRTW